MSVLEASYLVFRLQPHHENFNKRIVKQSKLYFYDSRQVAQHYLRGNIFESFVVSELVKARWLVGLPGNGYFWRDSHGHEVDYLLETAQGLVPVEIKSGETVQPRMFDGLAYWCKLAETESGAGCLVYGGKERQDRKNGHVVGWSILSELLNAF